MMQVLSVVVFVVVILSAGNAVVERRMIQVRASLPAAVLPLPKELVTGTLTYHRNNVGAEVPYIVYRSAYGNPRTHALVFTSVSSCITPKGEYPCTLIKEALPSYFEGEVVAEGVVKNESLIVEQLSGL